jgi:hypothetical protein
MPNSDTTDKFIKVGKNTMASTSDVHQTRSTDTTMNETPENSKC